MTNSAGKAQRFATKPALLAILLSFSIYLLPIFTPHAGLVFWPLMLFGGLQDGAVMALAAAAGAFVLQGLTALFFFLLLRRWRWWKLLVIAAASPVLFAAVNFTFLYAVPALVLIEPDWSDDFGQLQRACVAPDVSLLPVNAGVSLSLEARGIAWVRDNEGTGAKLLSMPDCHLEPVGEMGTRRQLISVNAAGEGLLSTYTGKYFYAQPDSAVLQELMPPAGRNTWNPLLTRGGSELAWLARGTAGSAGRPHLIRLRDLEPGDDERTIEVALPPRDSLTLLEADPPFFTLGRYRNEILVVDETGSVIWGPVSPPGIHDAQWGFRRVGPKGWVAWDGYREEGQSRIVWSLEEGSGEVVMPRGRSIESVAVSPDGGYIAYSTESNTYFNASGRLVLLRSGKGEVLYRRRLAQFARIHLAFLGNSYLAFRNLAEDPSGVAVYHVLERKN